MFCNCKCLFTYPRDLHAVFQGDNGMLHASGIRFFYVSAQQQDQPELAAIDYRQGAGALVYCSEDIS